jgi:hypothetical protein
MQAACHFLRDHSPRRGQEQNYTADGTPGGKRNADRSEKTLDSDGKVSDNMNTGTEASPTPQSEAL